MVGTLIVTIKGYKTASNPTENIPIRGLHAIVDHKYTGEGNNAGAKLMVDSRGRPLPGFTDDLKIILVGQSGKHDNVIECRTMSNNLTACHIGKPANHIMFNNLETLMNDPTIGPTYGGVELICCPRPVITETAEGRDVDAGHAISAEADIEIHAFEDEHAQSIQTRMYGNNILGNFLDVRWEDLVESSEDDDSEDDD